jgi:hypothetical protein
VRTVVELRFGVLSIFAAIAAGTVWFWEVSDLTTRANGPLMH